MQLNPNILEHLFKAQLALCAHMTLCFLRSRDTAAVVGITASLYFTEHSFDFVFRSRNILKHFILRVRIIS